MKQVLKSLWLAALLFAVLGAVSAASAQSGGSFGENDSLSWSLSEGVLTITGTGNMPAFSTCEDAPWYRDLSSRAGDRNRGRCL